MKLLLVLPQSPFDRSSGAARSMRTICEMLVPHGFDVHCVATTATEFGKPQPDGGLALPPFNDNGVAYRLLNVENLNWRVRHGKAFDKMFDDELSIFRPDVVFTYGGFQDDLGRHERARRHGAKVIFGLRNDKYLSPTFFEKLDGVITPSEYLACLYRKAVGLSSTPLPLPMDLDDVIAKEQTRIFVTMVNPVPEKGLMFMARLAEELSVKCIPVLVVESRGSRGAMLTAGLGAGFNLERHKMLIFKPPTFHPKRFYALTRVLAVPSLWQEPAGRVAVEALLNGIPPIVSGRGGLTEVCNGGGFVLPIPAEITPQTSKPVSVETVQPWIDLIVRLQDQQFYEQACIAARRAGEMYRPENVAPRYVDYFRRVVNGAKAA